MKKPFTAVGEHVDVVVFAAPQLSIIEMAELADICNGRHRSDTTDVIVCTSAQVYGDAVSMGYVDKIETFGGRVLVGTVFTSSMRVRLVRQMVGNAFEQLS